ncbi:MAG: DUF6493 family protein [Thermoguttaceae bacterium]|nr:DUF6493 family protein [Thermoguttaceae bacterium]
MSDDFDALLTNSDGRLKAPLEFAQAVAELTEAERRRFSKAAQKQISTSRAGERDNLGWPTVGGHMARLALLACAPKSVACRRMPFHWPPADMGRPDWSSSISDAVAGSHPFEQAAVKILTDRRPDWADQWLELQLADQRDQTLSAALVRRLIRDGVCSRPKSDGYAKVISNLCREADFDNDPELLEDAWLLFQVPTGAFGFITRIKRIEAEQHWKEKSADPCWPRWFYYLAHHGKIDRGRLLDALLAALWREFPTQERAGLVHFHNLLAPTEEELLARQHAYIELLRNPGPPVVTFTLQVLKSLAKSEQFSAGEFLRAVPSVFDITTKAQPKLALAVLKILLRKRADLEPIGVEVLIRALSHPESDVQIASLSLLETLGSDKLPPNELRCFRGRVSPLAQPKLEELLTKSNLTAAATSPAEAEGCVEALDLSDIRERIAAIPSQLRAAWKLDESLAACEAGRLPVACDPGVVPGALAGLAEVAPIGDVAELIDTIGEAIERVRSPMEIERILDGLSRLGRRRPADFSARTGAIRQRLRQLAHPERSEGMTDEHSLLSARSHLGALLQLLGTWLEPDVAVPEAGREPSPEQMQATMKSWLDSVRDQLSSLIPGVPDQLNVANEALAELERIGPEAFSTFHKRTVPVLEVLGLRARLVQLRLHHREPPMPLLALPTHEHGWIDPRVFVDRLRGLEEGGLVPSRLDLLVALSRLAPDHREDALPKAVELHEPYGRIVRYALGENLHPTEADRAWKHAWLAAGRSRSPRGTLDELAPLELPDAANAIQPARFRLRYERIPDDSYQRSWYTSSKLYLDIEPEGESALAPEDYPLPVLTQRLGSKNNYLHSFGLPPWGEEWLASHWPANADPFLAGAVQRLLFHLDTTASSWRAAVPLMTPLLHAELQWSDTALQTLWLGLFSRDADARSVASDALLEGILDGRAHSEPLGRVLVEIANRNWAKLNRLGNALRPVIRVSLWGSLVIGTVLDELIASWTPPPRDAHHILQIQLELLMEIGGSLSDRASKTLAGFQGAGKTAKLAGQLVRLRGSDRNPKFRQALLEGLNIRLARAERTLPAQ